MQSAAHRTLGRGVPGSIPSGASSVVALSKSHFHSSMFIVYICSYIVAIKALQS